VLAVVVNALDPELVVVSEGLGGEPSFLSNLTAATQPLVAYPVRPLDIVGSALGADGGVIGAALATLQNRGR
jgi:predicted NBD/HSP70 family sugar kinase